MTDGGTRRSSWDLHLEHQSEDGGSEDQSSTPNKFLVEVYHPQQPLQGRVVSRWWESSDGREVLVERNRPRAGDQMS